MELWRPESCGQNEPKVLGAANLCIAVALHVALFAGFWVFAVFHGLFDKEEEIIPIDLAVVVVENLDGKEDEPPPLKKPEPPPPPKPKPKPKPAPKKPDPPKELEKIVTNVVAKTEKKKEEPKKPEKTEKELREERMKQMRERAKVVDKTTIVKEPPKPQPNGRTDKKTLSDAEIQKRLNEGYNPGKSTNLASSTEEFAYNLIKKRFEEKWDPPPWTDTLKPMAIRVPFGPGGKIGRVKFEARSGDNRADKSLEDAAARVGAIPELPPAFIEKHGRNGVLLQFTVKPH